MGHHVEGEYVNLKDPTHTHRGDTLSAPKMIPHSTYLLLHCMTTNGTWIGLKLRLSRQRLSAFCSEETTPTSAHSFLLVKGFSLNNVQTSLCLCLGKCSFPEVVEGKGRIILYFAQRDISCSLVQGCTPTLSSPHHQFGPSKIDC